MNNTALEKTEIRQTVKPSERLDKALKGYIDCKACKPGQIIGSEYAMAREHGVSRMTVRRVIDDFVNKGLLERKPGKGIFIRKTTSVVRKVQAILGDQRAADSCFKTMQGAQLWGHKCGVKIDVYDMHGNVEQGVKTINELPNSGFDGSLIVSVHNKSFLEEVFQLKLKGYPIVLIDRDTKGIDISSICSDNYSGGYIVGQKLIELGHRRIGFVGKMNASTVLDRLEGLKDALNDCGIPFDRTLFADFGDENPQNISVKSVDHHIRGLMGREDRPTAIFFACDHLAAHAYKTLKSMGFAIGRDISVVGFDGDPLCDFLTPMLATVKQDFVQIGKVALEMLLRKMEEPNCPIEHSILPVTWSPNESVAKNKS